MIEPELIAARQLIASGNLDAARSINRQILDRVPNHPAALLQAARIENLSGNYRRAQQLTLSAAKQPVRQPQEIKNLLHRLQVHHLRDEIGQLIAAHPAETIALPALLDAIATTLNQINEPRIALRYLNRGVALAPRSTALLASRAQTYFFLGQFQDASQDISRCLALSPDIGFCWWLKSRLPKQAWNAAEVDQMRRLATVRPAASVDTAYAAYALHNALDAMGDYDAAAVALNVACAVRRNQVQYHEGNADALFAALRRYRPPTPGDSDCNESITPVFIVGMHRSGTTLLEQLLDSQPHVHGAGELYDFTAQMRLATNHHCRSVIDQTIIERAVEIDLFQVGKGYLNAISPLHQASDTHVIDKLPPNFMNVGFICAALPKARILHMTRDPMETCFSNLREPFSESTATYSYDQVELGRYFTKYRAMMEHWHERHPERIMDVDYADLTANPQGMLREIAEFCGIAYEPSRVGLSSTAKAITTASAGQARNQIVARDTPKWTPYQHTLKALRDALAG